MPREASENRLAKLGGQIFVEVEDKVSANLAMLDILGQTQSGKLPALMRIEEIAIGCPNVAAGRDARAAPQHHLVAHEFTVVLANGADGRTKSWIGDMTLCVHSQASPNICRSRRFRRHPR